MRKRVSKETTDQMDMDALNYHMMHMNALTRTTLLIDDLYDPSELARIVNEYETLGVMTKAGADSIRENKGESSVVQKPKFPITVDPEFRSIIPPLTDDERKQLAENILAKGCLDPIKLWKDHDIVVDGHNRFEICTARNIPYTVQYLRFKSRDDVKLWIVAHQLGRRNINAYQRARVALALKPVLEAKAKLKQRGGPGGKLLSQNSAEAFDTRLGLAKLSSVSHDTISKVIVIEELASPQQKAALERGEESINSIYKAVNKRPKERKKAPGIAPAVEYDTVIHKPKDFDVEITVRLNPLQADALDIDTVIAGLKTKLIEWCRKHQR